jgi:hypothetical protein
MTGLLDSAERELIRQIITARSVGRINELQAQLDLYRVDKEKAA